MRVFLVRHGQSEANLTRHYAGQSDVKLTDLGLQQAAAIRPVLKDISFDRVFSSDLSRAVDTQKQVLPGYTAEQTPLLREISVGNLAGKSIVEFWASHGSDSQTVKYRDYTPYGGENMQMLDARVRRFMDTLESLSCENVAVFAHRGVLISFLRNILDSKAFNIDIIQCDNCAVFVLEYNGNNWRILALNYGKKL